MLQEFLWREIWTFILRISFHILNNNTLIIKEKFIKPTEKKNMLYMEIYLLKGMLHMIQIISDFLDGFMFIEIKGEVYQLKAWALQPDCQSSSFHFVTYQPLDFGHIYTLSVSFLSVRG